MLQGGWEAKDVFEHTVSNNVQGASLPLLLAWRLSFDMCTARMRGRMRSDGLMREDTFTASALHPAYAFQSPTLVDERWNAPQRYAVLHLVSAPPA